MKQFKTVFNFEFSTLLKNKTLIITTIVLAILTFGVASIPTIINFFNRGNEEVDVLPDDNFANIGFIINFDDNTVYLDAFDITEDELFASVDELKEALNKGLIDKGFNIITDTRYEMYAKDISVFSFEQSMVEEVLRQIKMDRILVDAGIDVDIVHQSMQVEISSEVISMGKDASKGMFFSYAILFILYVLILLYGTNVSTSVAREKDSRTMELLITSTKPGTLILGKVLAAGLMGILQVSILVGTIVLGVYLNKMNYPPAVLSLIGGNMGLDVLLVYVMFSASGYMLYLFIYAALGSLVSKVEDVSKAVAPITYIFIAAYLIASISMQMPNSSLAVVSSYIPFVSMFTMPIRFMLTTVSWISVISSLVIMFVSTILLAALSIYIYRFGSLNYGNKIRIKQIIKSFKRN